MAETVGWLVDKISIIELKIFHMREQAARTDVSPEFRDRCEGRLAVMAEQRDDLATELTKLAKDVAAGRVPLTRMQPSITTAGSAAMNR